MPQIKINMDGPRLLELLINDPEQIHIDITDKSVEPVGLDERERLLDHITRLTTANETITAKWEVIFARLVRAAGTPCLEIAADSDGVEENVAYMETLLSRQASPDYEWRKLEYQMETMRRRVDSALETLPVVRLVLHCPRCQSQHIDKHEWLTRLHRTHLCEGCGYKWQPASLYSIGVEEL